MALTGLREMFANRRQAAEAARKAQMLDSFEAAGLGYFWSTDATGNLEYLSSAAFGNLGSNRLPTLELCQSLVVYTAASYRGLNTAKSENSDFIPAGLAKLYINGALLIRERLIGE